MPYSCIACVLYSNSVLSVLWITYLGIDITFVLISCHCNSFNFSYTSFTAKRIEAVQTLYVVCIQPGRIHFCLYVNKSFLFSFILFRVSMHRCVLLLLSLWWMAFAVVSVCCWHIWQNANAKARLWKDEMT